VFFLLFLPLQLEAYRGYQLNEKTPENYKGERTPSDRLDLVENHQENAKQEAPKKSVGSPMESNAAYANGQSQY